MFLPPVLIGLLPYFQVFPSLVDFQMSAWSGPLDWLPARLHSYTESAWSVNTQSSPLEGSAVVVLVQVAPWLVDL